MARRAISVAAQVADEALPGRVTRWRQSEATASPRIGPARRQKQGSRRRSELGVVAGQTLKAPEIRPSRQSRFQSGGCSLCHGMAIRSGSCLPVGPTSSSSICELSTPSPTNAQREQALSLPQPAPPAPPARGGRTASSMVACATATLLFKAAPPSIFGGSPRTLPAATDAAEGPPSYKVLQATGQPRRRLCCSRRCRCQQEP
jgi:hypothetical protein